MNSDNNPQSQALDQLVKDLGIDNLPEEKQNDLLVKMTEVLLKRIFLETMERLDEEGREEYYKLAEDQKSEPEKLEEFFQRRIPNYEEMIQGVIEDFRSEMMKGNIN